jgi:hypothetical protein
MPLKERDWSPIEIVEIGDAVAIVSLGVEVRDGDEAIGIGERKRPQHDRVEAGEQRRVRGDAQRKRDDRDDGEARVLSQRPPGVPNVLQEGVHRSPLFARGGVRDQDWQGFSVVAHEARRFPRRADGGADVRGVLRGLPPPDDRRYDRTVLESSA